MSNMFMVRAGEAAVLANDFRKKNLVAIGWKELGDLSKLKDKDSIKDAVFEAFPNENKHHNYLIAGQIYRFILEFQKGDYVLTYDHDKRVYLVGKINGDYEYNTKLLTFHNIRRVEWLGEVSRDVLSISTKNSLGAISTIFEITEPAKSEILDLLDKKERSVEHVDDEHKELDTIKEDIINRSNEFIKDIILDLSWDDMERLIAGLLRAMGYKTRISPPGPDRGRDVMASKDGLGLEDPRIIVEVKHRKGQMGSKHIRSFLGALRQSHKGLYVSTGGFSKDAKYEAERANVPITLIDIDELVSLVVQYYDDFDMDSRALIPLTKIYWPE